ncbi:hypothetical protein [Ruminococcus sp.]|uniref:hypothetical protein n=1 Tax=Ruminococcus sp. TaxID=41978 RepID=UPI0025D150A5|nr:hypothetical protein [Ruminococcus sp.]MCR4640101.1 hypothetical protein [Ruminococcus sp.]
METFLFILMFAVSVAVTAVFLHETKSDIRGKEPVSKRLAAVRRVSLCAALVLVFIAAAELLHIINIGAYSGAFTVLGAMAGISALVCTMNKKRRYHSAVWVVKAVIIAAVLETTVFNAPTFRLWFGTYKSVYFSAEECSDSADVNFHADTGKLDVRGDRTSVFTLEDINFEVADVFVDLDYDTRTKAAEVSVDAMDETCAVDYRPAVAEGRPVIKRPHSQYIQLHLSGDVSRLKVSVSPFNSGAVSIKGIGLNQQIPMSISWARLALIIFGIVFWQLMMNSKTMQQSITKNKRIFRLAAVFITDAACLAAIVITFVKLDNYSITDIMKRTEGNQMTQELVEAFENGSTSLLEKPSDELNSFDTPYTGDARDKANLEYEWDHVYFYGKYYSYYGIAPVVLLFLPYHKLTGYYFPDSMAVLLFALIGIIGLTKLYREFLKKLFPKTPTGIAVAGLIILQVVSGIWFSIGRPDFYEIAMSAGFAALTWAVYFMLSADIIGTGKPVLSRTAVSSLLFAIAVLCRPTLVLYCITAGAFMFLAVPRAAGAVKNGKKPEDGSRKLRYILCAILPMVCIGAIQMWYNYDRFGSVFEFGIQYSLTINDFTKTQFHSRLSLVPIYNYMFNPPTFSMTYPNISTEFQFLNAGGFFYADLPSTRNTSGLFFLALPMFVYLLSFKALRQLRGRKKKLLMAFYVGVPCLLIPFGIIASVWESGYAVRYMVDFSWQSLLGALAIMFFLYERLTDKTKKKLVFGFMWFSAMWALIVGGVQAFNQAFRFDVFDLSYPEMAYDVQRIFAFWN